MTLPDRAASMVGSSRDPEAARKRRGCERCSSFREMNRARRRLIPPFLRKFPGLDVVLVSRLTIGTKRTDVGTSFLVLSWADNQDRMSPGILGCYFRKRASRCGLGFSNKIATSSSTATSLAGHMARAHRAHLPLWQLEQAGQPSGHFSVQNFLRLGGACVWESLGRANSGRAIAGAILVPIVKMRIAAGCFVFAALGACRGRSLSVGGRDAGSGGQTITWTFGIGGSGFVGTGGAGGAGGRTLDASDDSLDACAFGTLLNAAVNNPSVIGYCAVGAVCDANAWSSDAGVAACSPLDSGGTLEFVNDELIIRYPWGTSYGCWPALVFDGEGKLVSGRVDITAWADCRWVSYAGKSFYSYCDSE